MLSVLHDGVSLRKGVNSSWGSFIQSCQLLYWFMKIFYKCPLEHRVVNMPYSLWRLKDLIFIILYTTKNILQTVIFLYSPCHYMRAWIRISDAPGCYERDKRPCTVLLPIEHACILAMTLKNNGWSGYQATCYWRIIDISTNWKSVSSVKRSLCMCCSVTHINSYLTNKSLFSVE